MQERIPKDGAKEYERIRFLFYGPMYLDKFNVFLKKGMYKKKDT